MASARVRPILASIPILLATACGIPPASPTPVAALITTPTPIPTADTVQAANRAASPPPSASPTPNIEATTAAHVQATNETRPAATPSPPPPPTPEPADSPSLEPTTPTHTVLATATPTATPAVVAPDTGTPVQASPQSVRLTYSLVTLYFPVTGTTTQDIFDSVEANGPEFDQEVQDRFTSGLTESDSSYRIEFFGSGESCQLESAVINLSLVVTLPQHSDPIGLNDLQFRRWQDFAAGVAAHEQTHVDIYMEGTEAFKNDVEVFPETFSDCDALEASVSSTWELESILIDQTQERFHESEKRLSERVRGPIRQQIDDNELEMDEMQDKLALVSSEIDELKVQIDNIDVLLGPYNAGMAAIRDQYPDLVLPSDTFAEYERLSTERNRLTNLRNKIASQVNGLVGQHNRTVEELNRLTDQTNQLIDDLAWLP